MNKVAIFRNQLFKNSESFISNQANSLKNYSCLYLGRKKIGSNDYLNVKTISDNYKYNGRFGEAWNAITRDPRAYVSIVRGNDIDIIHSHFGIDSVYALEVALKLDVPLISTLHGFDVTTKKMDLLRSGSPAWINYLFFSHKLKKQGDLFLCVSDFIKNKAIEAGYPESKLITHYIGIDVNGITPKSFECKEKTILHIARLVEKKGTDNLIDAINKIKDKLNGYKVKIVGNGPLYTVLKQKIETLGLTEHIIMLGELPHTEVMKLVSTAAVMLVPSVTAESGDSEGLPTVILEAAANEIPVIGTYHAGIPEAIVNEKTGLLVKERDVDALSERIQYLIENDNERYIYGINAREYMLSKFNLEKQTEILEGFYTRLINER